MSNPMTPSEAEKMAMAYAKVEYEGLNKLGQPMYSAEHPGLLTTREIKMHAFLAGHSSRDGEIVSANEERDSANRQCMDALAMRDGMREDLSSARQEIEALKNQLRQADMAFAQIQTERNQWEKEYREAVPAACPECGYFGCKRGRKACDTEIDDLKSALTSKDAELQAARDALREIALDATEAELPGIDRTNAEDEARLYMKLAIKRRNRAREALAGRKEEG